MDSVPSNPFMDPSTVAAPPSEVDFSTHALTHEGDDAQNELLRPQREAATAGFNIGSLIALAVDAPVDVVLCGSFEESVMRRFQTHCVASPHFETPYERSWREQRQSGGDDDDDGVMPMLSVCECYALGAMSVIPFLFARFSRHSAAAAGQNN
jgi:hypothetical protein